MSGKNTEPACQTMMESAMHQAMEAEKQAIDALVNTKRQAEEILMEARRLSNDIATRTDRRIAAIQKSQAKALKKRLDAIKLQQQRRAGFMAHPPEQAMAMEDAVKQLAARLTGGTPSLSATHH